MKRHYKSNILGKAFDSRCKRFFLMQKNAKFQFLGLSHMENENMTFSFVIPSYVPHKTPEKVGASWILKKSFVSWTSTVILVLKSNAEDFTRGVPFFQDMSNFTFWKCFSLYKTPFQKWKWTEVKNCNFHATMKKA